MKIYIDVIFIENVFMNYIIFLITSYVLKIKSKPYRIMISSVLGSLYVIVFITNRVSFSSNSIAKIVLSLVMTFIAFNPHSFKSLFKNLAAFYLVTFVIGGASFALIYTIDDKSLIVKNGFLIGYNSIKISLFATIVGFAVLSISFLYKKELLRKDKFICKIIISNGLESVETSCFIDSGNTLKDPISHKSVIIVEKNIIEKILDFSNYNEPILTNNLHKLNLDKFKVQNVRNNSFNFSLKGFKRHNNLDRFDNLNSNCNINKCSIRLIPFKSVGNDDGALLGIEVPLVKIIRDNQKDVFIKNAIIGIYKKSFNKNYHALIGLSLLYES